jgi:hypothetical protein
MNRIGDFGFLVAMFLLFANLGTLDFVGVSGRAAELGEGGAVVTAIGLFFFLGCAGKSAQIPLYTWLPDAMAGPTPVSALIHAATMVTAGVYLVARSSAIFALAPVASLTVALVGAITALFAATIGLKQWDIKKVLAYSTVSQLGYMFIGVGVGAYAAGVFHLVTHAFFKALLFLGSGSVIFAMHRAMHHTGSHAQHGWPSRILAVDVPPHVDRDAGDCRHPAVIRVLLEGRDPGICFCENQSLDTRRGQLVRHSRLGAVVPHLRHRARGGVADRDLHDADDAVHVPRAQPLGTCRASASA